MFSPFRHRTASVLLSALIAGALWSPVVASPQGGSVDDDREIKFVWSPPSNAAATVDCYRIYLSIDGRDFQLVATTEDNFYVVPGDSGACYRLRVTGVNAHEQEGSSSPESDEVLCLPQENTPVVFGFSSAEVQEGTGQLRLVWETTGYLEPGNFRVNRWDLQGREECLLDRVVLEETVSGSSLYRYFCVDRDVVVGASYRYMIQAVDPSGEGIVAISLCGQAMGPRTYRLHQNYPNPFNAETTLSYQLPEANHVVLTIFNARGQKVRTMVDAFEAPNSHLVQWDGTDQCGLPVASGIYFCQMWCGDFIDVKKMTVIR
jgi:hypothetical protein